MATLIVSAAVNIGIGLALNALFPPPDIEQAGPRLTDLGFTSAAYGRFVNVTFGTDRVDGNIIDSTDPAIEEVVNVESVSAKGGGQKINTTTYTYFLTCRVSFCIEGAENIIRLWGDGKLILDKSGSSQILKEGTTLLFYPGGPDQIQDPEEVARRGSDIPAYRHLTSIKLDRMPLADFGNRIPNFTAEISFSTDSTNIPHLNMDEPPGLDVPGALTGAGNAFMSFNPDRNEFYSLKGATTGVWSADASTLDFKNVISNAGTSSIPHYTVGRDGFAYMQGPGGNSAPLEKVDIDTGEVVATFGSSGASTSDGTGGFTDSGQWYQLQVSLPGVGVRSVVFHFNELNGLSPNGAIVDPSLMPIPIGASVTTPVVHIISEDDGLGDGDELHAMGIPDHDRNRFFIMQSHAAGNEYRLVEYTFVFGFIAGVSGLAIVKVNTRLVRQFTRGTFAAGDDFEGTGDPNGWAMNTSTGDLILGNGTSMILYNPDDDVILANRTDQAGSFLSENNYYAGNNFAWGVSDASNGTIVVIDTQTLETTREIMTDDIGWQGTDGRMHERSVLWDDRTQAVFLSRVDVGSTAVDPNRILKIFVNRLDASAGVGLDEVVSALSTTYQRQTMAGLLPADIDVTTLAGDLVPGYTLNRKSTMKGALEPLRTRYQFDAVQSDWIIKFPKRGAASVVTIPEEDIGILKRGRSLTDEPPVREIRVDDLSLPMSLSVRYKDKDTDYQVGTERDKRQLFPNPTMRSKTELAIDIPIVEQSTAMKQVAQKQLLTMWNERVSYKSVIPWTYLALDATDVFTIGVFGETSQIRMSEMDFGASWAIEFTGVVQDTKSFSSTLAGSTALGHVATTVPSSLPTRLFPLDAPLLSLQDLGISTLSNAYMAVSGFEDTWPGTTIMKSLDNAQYAATGTANVEVPVAKVTVVPSVWEYVEGDFPNRIQEVADGGSMTIQSVRRIDFWASTTEALMLSGANHIAVKGADDEIEIIGFVDVVDNGDNTFTLERLLRGRLGTEDIADGGMAVGDEVIGLSGATNLKESESIKRQSLNISELDTALFFKGVTIGTLIEDATAISATYTGRDIKPYSVVHTTAVIDAGDVDVDWERRVRGPLAGEWLDLLGDVPLNETQEKYEVIITDGSASVTKIVDDATLVTFTAAEIAGLSGTMTVTVAQVSGTGLKSPITPSSTAIAA